MKKPKLVFCDIDGTLIPYGYGGLPEETYSVVRALRERGIGFVLNSGRQYHSMRVLFSEMPDDIYYVGENGGVVYDRGPEEPTPILRYNEIDRDLALGIAHSIEAIDGSTCVANDIYTSYCLKSSTELISVLRDGLSNKLDLIDDWDEIRGPIASMAAYCPHNLGEAESVLRPMWGDKIHMACAGPTWWDFNNANKGDGLIALCQALGVDPAETVAFGDNWNDVPMLEAAGTGYIMSTSFDELRALFPNCDNVLEKLKEYL
ncbi:MAG: HAD family phosphatase [Oscillospiraceae bacterium]|nr:HAD family phosphatase [Oscillospiraceae bacterium]